MKNKFFLRICIICKLFLEIIYVSIIIFKNIWTRNVIYKKNNEYFINMCIKLARKN